MEGLHGHKANQRQLSSGLGLSLPCIYTLYELATQSTGRPADCQCYALDRASISNI